MRVMEITLKMGIIIALGVFCGSFMDAIAGGGGLITNPIYMISGLPVHSAIGTNKFSAGFGEFASLYRFIKKGYVDFKLALPALVFAVIGSFFGAKIQLLVDENILKIVLLAILPVVAFFILRSHELPEKKEEMPNNKRLFVICFVTLIVGMYNGFYGPGTGTFLLLGYTKLAKLDVRTASGNVKMANAASDISSLVVAISSKNVAWAAGCIGLAASLAGHFVGSGLAIKNGTKIIRPVVIFVLVLLAIKVFTEIF